MTGLSDPWPPFWSVAAVAITLGLSCVQVAIQRDTEEVPVAAPAGLLASEETPTSKLFAVTHLQRLRATGTGDIKDRKRRVELLRELGFTGSRIGFEWSVIEAVEGQRDWARYDSIVSELESAGLRAYGMIGYTPTWARPPRTLAAHRPVIEGSPERGDTAFAALAAAAARRFRGKIDHWEIWNEPNILQFWIHMSDGKNLGPDPVDYLALFRLARDSIMATNEQAIIVTAGLSPGPRRYAGAAAEGATGRPSGYPALLFLSKMLQGGLEADHIGLHPYSPLPPGEVLPGDSLPYFPNIIVDSVFAVLDAYGLEGADVWVTEWGVNQTVERSDSLVATWYRGGLRTLLCHPRIPVVTIYALADWGPSEHYGLFDRQGEITVGGRAVQETLASWRGCGR